MGNILERIGPRQTIFWEEFPDLESKKRFSTIVEWLENYTIYNKYLLFLNSNMARSASECLPGVYASMSNSENRVITTPWHFIPTKSGIVVFYYPSNEGLMNFEDNLQVTIKTINRRGLLRARIPELTHLL